MKELPRICANVWTNHSEPVVAECVNPGGWFGHLHVIAVVISNALCPWVVVEADHEQDAIDVLADSAKYGHLINVDEDMVKEDREEFGDVYGDNYKGDYTTAGNDGHVVDLTNVSFVQPRKIEYFVKIPDHKDSDLLSLLDDAIRAWYKQI